MGDTAVLNLDGTVLTSKEELHNTIFYQLALPDYYGRNLDALWDVLSAWSQPLQIVVEHSADLERQLGGYGEMVLQLFQEAEEENNAISVDIRL